MYYSNQIKEIERSYAFLETHNDRNAGLNWYIADRVLEESNIFYFDSLSYMTVSEAINHLQNNLNPDAVIELDCDGNPYIDQSKEDTLTDEEYLDYIANSFDFRSEYNLSQSWVDRALTVDDQKLHDMAFDLTKRRYDILNSFKKEELVEDEDIVLFLLDKEAFRHRVANLYTYGNKGWDETSLEKKIKEIKLEAFVTFEQLRIV